VARVICVSIFSPPALHSTPSVYWNGSDARFLSTRYYTEYISTLSDVWLCCGLHNSQFTIPPQFPPLPGSVTCIRMSPNYRLVMNIYINAYSTHLGEIGCHPGIYFIKFHICGGSCGQVPKRSSIKLIFGTYSSPTCINIVVK
jgi:hypothetical protein